MAIDQPIPQTAIPSSQPTDDEQVVFHPARSDNSRPPAERIPPPTIADLVMEMKKWSSIKDPSFFSSLSLDKLRNLSDLRTIKAFELNVNIPNLIQSKSHD